MAKLFKQILILTAISFSLFFLVKFLVRDHQQKNYISAFIDKLEMLQASKSTRKIVLIGGSSVGWGLSAELIEKELGIRAINLGHHAGFGLVDYQDFILKNISKDDIIVFASEWRFYKEPAYSDKATLDNLIRYNYKYGELLQNNWYIFRSFCSEIELSRLQPQEASTPYRYDCLNNNGDIVAQCSLSPGVTVPYPVERSPLNLDSFARHFPFLKSNKTIFVFPPTQQRIYDTAQNYLHYIEKTLREGNYPVFGHVEDNVYPDSLFFDAEYHLTCEARTARTKKFIEYLKREHSL